MTINVSQLNTTNYLVPAAGQTHAIKCDGVFSAAPYTIDWRQFRIDAFPFQPQGVYIDNTQGTDDLVILILPINYAVTCAAGQTLEAQFPAPSGQTCSITGNGQASIIFVDYPVLPSGAQVSIKGTPGFILDGIATTDTLNVQMSPLAQGAVPYQVIKYAVPATAVSGFVGAGPTSTNIAVPANQNLKRAQITITGNAFAAAGAVAVTLTLNDTQIFAQTVPLPTTAPASGYGVLWQCVLDFDGLGLSSGAAGALVLAVSSALGGGFVQTNAYFTP